MIFFHVNERKRLFLLSKIKMSTLLISLLVTILPLQARGDSVTYNFNLKNVSLVDAMEVVREKTGYIFFYQADLVDASRKVNLQVNGQSIKETLDRLFDGTCLEYRVKGNQVFLYKKAEVPAAQPESLEQNNKITVTGVVVDAEGVPVIGANVLEDGTTNGTITDINGRFTLSNVNPGAKVNVSFIGYTTTSFMAKEGHVDVVLREDPMTMEEVVVIGYGTQRRSLVTSAISKLELDESTTRLVTSPGQLLNGRIAGVTTFTGSGNLGSGERMSIRGMSSISAGNEPLYVIDGVPITSDNANLFNFGEDMSPLSTLNIADIESIVVLKDAASAAIYGSRATNGVVVITTKNGREGKSDVRINVSTGLSQFPNVGKIKFADSELYVKSYNEGVANYNRQYGYMVGDRGYKVPISNPFGNLPDTDWMGLITQTGSSFNVDASFSGGTEKTKYYMGANYNNMEGIIKTNKMDKVNFNAKLNHQFKPWLEVGLNNSANYTKNYQVPGANLGSTVIGRAIEQRPFDRPYKPNGEYYIGGTDELTRHNIVQILNEQDAYLENFRFIGNYYAQLKYKEKLTYRYSFSADIYHTYDFTYYNENHPYGMGSGRMIDQNRLVTNILSDNVLNYNDKFFDNLSLSATLGHSFQLVKNRNASVDGRGFPSPSFDVGSVASEILGSTSAGVYAMESYFGRTTLSYLDRYILTGTFRTDGSSKFSRENRWGWFPSVSLGWNISNEEFMKDADTELKFRVSYGKTGNQAGIGRYDYQALMMGGYNYRGGSGIAVSTFGNKDLTWEKADQYDVGFDVTFLKGRINMMIDGYLKNTKDLLYSMPIHATSGVTSIISNIGSMRNVGVEYTLNTHFNIGKVEWLSQFNIATNRNKITSLIDETAPISIGSNRALKVGHEMGAFYIFKMEGIYQYDGEVPKPQYDMGIRAGDVKWKDVDGNGIINDNDRVLIGSSNPDFFGGFNNTFRYRNLQLDAFITYSSGQDVYAQWMTTVARPGYRMALLEEYARNAWIGPGSTNFYTRAMEGDVNNNRNSDRFLKDGSFMRLRTVTLGYNLPKKLLEPMKVKSLRLYLQGDNLLLLTCYPGWDPEISTDLDPRYVGVDNWVVPQARTILIGANLSF